MSEEEFITITINLVITTIAYLIIPIYAKFISKEQYDNQEARKLACLSSVLIYMIFSMIQIFVNKRLASISPAILWGFIGYFIMKNKQSKQNPSSISNNSDLDNLTQK